MRCSIVQQLWNNPRPFDKPAFLICDSNFIKRWGIGLVLPKTLSKEQFIKSSYLVQAHSWEELAQKLAIPYQNLHNTITQYNTDALQGIDYAYGKGNSTYNQYLGDANQKPNPCLAPIIKSPFYAIKIYPGDIGTSAGIITNSNAQVLNSQGDIIDGLFAIGNDMNSIMNGHYPAAGITLGPALTFAWIAANII